MAKANTERMIYQAAEQDGSFDAMAILPVHVIGPLLTPNHDQGLEHGTGEVIVVVVRSDARGAEARCPGGLQR